MEKIYEEKRNQKKPKIDGVTMLSFVVAAFAIVSLIAAGFNQISFALPDTTVEIDDKFTAYNRKEADGINDVGLFGFTIDGDILPGAINMHFYKNGAGTEIPLFCLQRDITFGDGKEYNKSLSNTVSNDVGLQYLMANLYPNVTYTYDPAMDVSKNTDKQLETWITQAAIWYYLNGTNENNNESDYSGASKVSTIAFSQDELVPTEYIGYATTDANRKAIFDVTTANGKTINEIIAEAKKKTGVSASITVNMADDVVTDKDKTYYFSGLVTVVGSVSDPSLGEYNGFDVSLSNAPEGTIITDQDGNEIKTLTNLTPDTKFYVRVPIDKVTEVTDISVNVKGHFRMYDGNIYVTGTGDQEIATVTFRSQDISKGASFTVAPTEDTGMSSAQTIYFIGLIVLLCGVGIIYANSKPSEA